MSVGSLKRFLVILNLAALLGLSGTAYGFWKHGSYLKDTREMTPNEWPDFTFKPATSGAVGDLGVIKNIRLPLGIYPKEPEKVAKKDDEPKISPIESVLRNLGEIIGAVAFLGPYDEGNGFKPSITFKLKDNSIRTLALGEAIETRPHPDFGKMYPVPYRYKFVGCERDEKDPTLTYFLFDMKCDDTDIQRVKWHGDIKVNPPMTAAGGPEGPQDSLSGTEFVVVSEAELERRRKAAEEARNKKAKVDEPIKSVKPPPDKVEPIKFTGGVPDSLGEMEDGTWVASDEGSRYMKDNWKKVVEEARTSTYHNPKTGAAEGILVTRLRRNSVANKLGIYPDDVILSINGKRVTKKSQAISIVRNELEKKKQNILEVRILRNGREIVKRYDARDSETRRNARESFRNRR
ncbi:MAG: PDZ domain-containing protein [Planctomycetota bacterium]|jgi:hypothetical protein